jgi:hypothetical protein
MKYKIIKDYKEEAFRAVTGINQAAFNEMLILVKTAYTNAHKRRGRHRKLSVEDMLLMTLEYYKEYRTLECIGASYGLRKTNVGKTIKWVEDVLITSGKFSLPGKKKLIRSDIISEVIVVDSTETPIERPKNRQRRYYSGKKKRHTVKFQVIIDRKTETILCIEMYNGKAHDLTIFKETTRLHPDILVLADSGYRGIQKVHANTLSPLRHKEDIVKLNEKERAGYKAMNKQISSKRMKIEHIIGRIKRFKIAAEKYRNRRRRLALGFNLICGIVNYQNPLA